VRTLLSVSLVLLTLAVTGKADIIYDVSRTVGTGTATGFITTDGNTGTLVAADIKDWNILMTVGATTFDLTGPLSGNDSVLYFQGADLTATSTNLLFNFSGVDNGVFLLQHGLFSGLTYYCDAAAAGVCLQGESVVPGNVFDAATFQNVARSGNIVIGTATGTSSVPEPSTGILLLTSLVAAAFVGRKRIVYGL
jgi:hypothetical protein